MENERRIDWAINIFGMFTGRDLNGFVKEYFTPERILLSGNRTIVFWKDGSKTIVKLSEDETPDIYNAFASALAKKIFGSNSALKKTIMDKAETQKVRHGKHED